MAKILIVEDEPTIQAVLRELLKSAGHIVATADDGLAGLRLFHEGGVDLVLLDIMMPKLDGYGLARRIRETAQTPIIMLTALDDDEAQIKAFELQADDYITKPFSLKLVLMRIEAVLRRAERTTDAGADDETLTLGDIRLDPAAYQVFASGEEVALTKTEYDLLLLFMKNPGRVFTRGNLMRLVWGYDFGQDDKAVNIHIMNLRRKLATEQIETVRGVGYRFAKTSQR